MSPCPTSFPRLLLLLSHFSRVRLRETLWTAAHQAPLSTGFFRQEYWSGLPFPSAFHIARCVQADSGWKVLREGLEHQLSTQVVSGALLSLRLAPSPPLPCPKHLGNFCKVWIHFGGGYCWHQVGQGCRWAACYAEDSSHNTELLSSKCQYRPRWEAPV